MIVKDDLTKDTPIYVLVEYLNSFIEDKYPRDIVNEFEQGKMIGQLTILDMIKSICK